MDVLGSRYTLEIQHQTKWLIFTSIKDSHLRHKVWEKLGLPENSDNNTSEKSLLPETSIHAPITQRAQWHAHSP